MNYKCGFLSYIKSFLLVKLIIASHHLELPCWIFSHDVLDRLEREGGLAGEEHGQGTTIKRVDNQKEVARGGHAHLVTGTLIPSIVTNQDQKRNGQAKEDHDADAQDGEPGGPLERPQN